MKIYKITFSGRKLGAIGLSCQYTAIRKGETPGAARLALYDEYEHIHGAHIVEIELNDEPHGKE